MLPNKLDFFSDVGRAVSIVSACKQAVVWSGHARGERESVVRRDQARALKRTIGTP